MGSSAALQSHCRRATRAAMRVCRRFRYRLTRTERQSGSVLSPFFVAAVDSGALSVLHFVGAGVGVLLVWATVARRDLWPFSHYPMFAEKLDAGSVRFFRLQVRLSDGRVVGASGVADALVDPFHRECERLWASAGQPSAELLDELMFRGWREACRLEPALAGAEKVAIVMRVARTLPGDKVVVGEKIVHESAPVGRAVGA